MILYPKISKSKKNQKMNLLKLPIIFLLFEIYSASFLTTQNLALTNKCSSPFFQTPEKMPELLYAQIFSFKSCDYTPPSTTTDPDNVKNLCDQNCAGCCNSQDCKHFYNKNGQKLGKEQPLSLILGGISHSKIKNKLKSNPYFCLDPDTIAECAQLGEERFEAFLLDKDQKLFFQKFEGVKPEGIFMFTGSLLEEVRTGAPNRVRVYFYGGINKNCQNFICDKMYVYLASSCAVEADNFGNEILEINQSGDKPGGLYAHSQTTDNSNFLYIYGGYTYLSNSYQTNQNVFIFEISSSSWSIITPQTQPETITLKRWDGSIFSYKKNNISPLGRLNPFLYLSTPKTLSFLNGLTIIKEKIPGKSQYQPTAESWTIDLETKIIKKKENSYTNFLIGFKGNNHCWKFSYTKKLFLLNSDHSDSTSGLSILDPSTNDYVGYYQGSEIVTGQGCALSGVGDFVSLIGIDKNEIYKIAVTKPVILSSNLVQKALGIAFCENGKQGVICEKNCPLSLTFSIFSFKKKMIQKIY